MPLRIILPLIFIFNILVLVTNLSSQPSINIKDYSEAIDFSSKKVVFLEKGDRLDYRNADFDDSSWEIVSFPNNWYDIYPKWKGFCWYRLHIKFPEKLPEKAMGIRLGIIRDADEVYFNGKLIGSSGFFPPLHKHAYDKIRIYEIPTGLIETDRINVIAIRVFGKFSNANGPYKGNFIIAPIQKLQQDFLIKEFAGAIFIVLYFVVAIYFLVSFIRQYSHKEYLFFSLFTFTAAIYFLLRSQMKYFLSDNFFLFKRIEYIVLFLTVVMFFEMITIFFKRKHKFYHYIFYIATTVGIGIILFSSDINLWHTALYYFVQPSWFIPIIFFTYILFNDFRKTNEAKYLIIALLILCMTVANDIMVHRLVYNFTRLSQYGFSFLVLGIAFVMRNRYLHVMEKYHKFEAEKISAKKRSLSQDSIDKVDEAIRIIEQNYTTDITREEIAISVGLNSDHLGKIFKRHKDIKINDFINKLRIENAARQMINGDEKIVDIAFSVGFESLSTFYRIFQKFQGQSPMSYIEEKKDKDGK